MKRSFAVFVIVLGLAGVTVLAQAPVDAKTSIAAVRKLADWKAGI